MLCCCCSVFFFCFVFFVFLFVPFLLTKFSRTISAVEQTCNGRRIPAGTVHKLPTATAIDICRFCRPTQVSDDTINTIDCPQQNCFAVLPHGETTTTTPITPTPTTTKPTITATTATIHRNNVVLIPPALPAPPIPTNNI